MAMEVMIPMLITSRTAEDQSAIILVLSGMCTPLATMSVPFAARRVPGDSFSDADKPSIHH